MTRRVRSHGGCAEHLVRCRGEAGAVQVTGKPTRYAQQDHPFREHSSLLHWFAECSVATELDRQLRFRPAGPYSFTVGSLPSKTEDHGELPHRVIGFASFPSIQEGEISHFRAVWNACRRLMIGVAPGCIPVGGLIRARGSAHASADSLNHYRLSGTGRVRRLSSAPGALSLHQRRSSDPGIICRATEFGVIVVRPWRAFCKSSRGHVPLSPVRSGGGLTCTGGLNPVIYG